MEKENAELTDALEKSEQQSTLKKLQEARLLNDYERIKGILDRLYRSDTEICGCDGVDTDHRERVYQEDCCLCPGQVQRQVAAESEDLLQLRGRCGNSRYFRNNYYRNNLWTQKNGVTFGSHRSLRQIVTCHY